MTHHRHCRPRRVPPKPIDLCGQGVITEQRLRNLLAAVYDRLLADIHHHRSLADDEDESLVQALDNCCLAGGKAGQDGRRPAGRVTRMERFIRLAYACRIRLAEMSSHGPISLADLELLDALADIVNGSESFEWRIDRDCRIRFG